ncbi:helix-turn-helix domain-containing protein [Chloroflexota bacterium]
MDTREVVWLTIQGAAQRFGVTEQTIRNWIDRDVFPAYQMNPRGRVLIRVADIEEAIMKRRLTPKKWGLG